MKKNGEEWESKFGMGVIFVAVGGLYMMAGAKMKKG